MPMKSEIVRSHPPTQTWKENGITWLGKKVTAIFQIRKQKQEKPHLLPHHKPIGSHQVQEVLKPYCLPFRQYWTDEKRLGSSQPKKKKALSRFIKAKWNGPTIRENVCEKGTNAVAVKDTSERVETMTSDGEYCFPIAFVSLGEGKKMRRLSPFWCELCSFFCLTERMGVFFWRLPYEMVENCQSFCP